MRRDEMSNVQEGRCVQMKLRRLFRLFACLMENILPQKIWKRYFLSVSKMSDRFSGRGFVTRDGSWSGGFIRYD